MLGFLEVLNPIKWQDSLEEGKQNAKIHFSEKKYFGVKGLRIIHAGCSLDSAKLTFSCFPSSRSERSLLRSRY